MELHFNVKGKDRKAMVTAIESELGLESRYMGMPSAAYIIGDYMVGKYGELSFPDWADPKESGAVVDACVMATGVSPVEWDQDEADEPEEKPKLIITTAVDLDGEGISRLESLIESKESLLKKAIGTECLRIEDKDGAVSFPWFRLDVTDDERLAYMQLCSALCGMAKNSKRVTGKDKPVDNEKYAFRCFLLRLGFIGDEYKKSRKVLLKNFSGSSAYRKGGSDDEISE